MSLVEHSLIFRSKAEQLMAQLSKMQHFLMVAHLSRLESLQRRLKSMKRR
nr:MAG TPA: hypothetical protein [Caudoviricetes sp.]